jgi:ethanolamine transporter
MGCTISYTLPLALSVVKKELHKDLFLGLLCGIVTIPIGCFVAGIVCGISVLAVFITLLPLVFLAIIIAAGLIFAPNLCVKIFKVVAIFMNVIITIGLALGIFTAVTGIKIVPQFDSFENGALICMKSAITLSGAFPLMFLLTKLLNAPIRSIGRKTGLNPVSTVSLLTTIVSATPVLGVMHEMDRKGIVLNSAFAVSAAFTFGGHLAFTMAYDPSYIVPMIIGKLVSGIFAILLAWFVFVKKAKDNLVSKEVN